MRKGPLHSTMERAFVCFELGEILHVDEHVIAFNFDFILFNR
jgi:hypothetical protein